MKKILANCFIFFILLSPAYSQSVKYIIPDSGYQGTSFPITIIGSGTEWMVSNYFTIYFDSTGVTAFFNTLVNDTMIMGNVNIGGKAVTIPRTIYVLDKFSNPYTKDSALKVLLSMPVIPTLILPPDNATNQFQNVTLLWDSNAYATTFRVQLSTDSLFTTPYFDTVVANTPLQIRPDFLALGTKYYWRVNATNILGTSGWSNIRNFTVRTIGIKQISSEIPTDYKLFNNYPNPFNPNTNVRFQIPKLSSRDALARDHVLIKVYDILGKEIATLVNEKKSPGIYEVGFNGSNLPSGIYFVKMQADNFYGIIKIALLK